MKTTPWLKREGMYFQRGDGKGGEQGTTEDAIEGWRGQDIKNNRDYTNATEGFGTKDRSDLGKKIKRFY